MTPWNDALDPLRDELRLLPTVPPADVVARAIAALRAREEQAQALVALCTRTIYVVDPRDGARLEAEARAWIEIGIRAGYRDLAASVPTSALRADVAPLIELAYARARGSVSASADRRHADGRADPAAGPGGDPAPPVSLGRPLVEWAQRRAVDVLRSADSRGAGAGAPRTRRGAGGTADPRDRDGG